MCIYASDFDRAKEVLDGTGVAIGVVVDFPNGNETIENKKKLAIDALNKGATEIDMPINVGRLKSGEYEYIYKELLEVGREVVKRGGIFKPIARVDDLQYHWKHSGDFDENVENPFIVEYCKLVNRLQENLEAGYHQIMAKTSTGFDFQPREVGDKQGKDYEGATDEVLGLFSKYCNDNVGIKAAGKVRTFEQFRHIMKDYGVVRIGCTKTDFIANEFLKKGYVSNLGHTAKK